MLGRAAVCKNNKANRSQTLKNVAPRRVSLLELLSCRVGVSLQTPYCFTALLFPTAGAWSEWSVAGDSPREVLCGYVHCGCRYCHRVGPGNPVGLN